MIRNLCKGLLLMTAGYVLQRIGRWMQPKASWPHQHGGAHQMPPRPVVYPPDSNDPTGTAWLKYSPEMTQWLGRKLPPRESFEWN